MNIKRNLKRIRSQKPCSELTAKDVSSIIWSLNPILVLYNDEIVFNDEDARSIQDLFDATDKFEATCKDVTTEIKVKIVDFHHSVVEIHGVPSDQTGV